MTSDQVHREGLRQRQWERVLELERPSGLKQLAILSVLELVTGRSKPLEHVPRRTTGVPFERTRATVARNKKSSYQPPPICPVLPRRKRALSPAPLNERLNEQIQSPLFSLPPEVLKLIYRKVLGNHLVHIVRRQNRMGHEACKVLIPGFPDSCNEHLCRGFKLSTGLYEYSGQAYKDLMPLLQTCRKIYIDAVQILYSSNIFDFNSMESVIEFSTSILPKRFDTIQQLQLDFRFDSSASFSETTVLNDWERWQRTWRIIASIPTLQRIWLRISLPRPVFGQEEHRFLKQLVQVGRLISFEISLPPLKDKEMPVEKRCFKIIRRDH